MRRRRTNINGARKRKLLNGESSYTWRRVARTQQFPVRLGEATVTDILTNDEISLLRSLEKKSRTIAGNFTHKRYDRLETKGYIKRSSQSPSIQDMLYEITGAGKAALRAAGGAAG